MKKTLLMIAAIAGLATFNTSSARDDYQYKVLFEPGTGQLEAEARGRIMIYDGLYLDEVNLAMDQHYDRIENMMFVRTVIPTDSGVEELEEDGCD